MFGEELVVLGVGCDEAGGGGGGGGEGFGLGSRLRLGSG